MKLILAEKLPKSNENSKIKKYKKNEINNSVDRFKYHTRHKREHY